MKILYILHSHTLGGAEKHLITLMDGVSKYGITPIYAGQTNSWLHKEVQKRGYRFYNVPMHGFYDIVSMTKLAMIAKKERVHLIHGHLTRGAFYAGITSKLSRIPSIATAHSTNAGKHFGHVKHIIAVSEAVKKFLIQKGYSYTNITKIYNGIEDQYENSFTKRAENRELFEIKDDEIALCVIGRFLKDKGQDIAINALKQCKSKNLKLFLIGYDQTEWGKNIHKIVNELNLSSKVIFTGQKDDIPALLSAMDIYLMPSRREAFPLALLEACSMQKAIIASNVGGIPEIIENDNNGYLFECENINELAKAIDILANDKYKRKKFGDLAREKFIENFTSEQMIKNTINLYQKIIGI
ncbi:glycosyltransferase [Hydrogenimonas thermophila]|uniref:Glycosyltransferase involved in cell wall bisynthesis n=1 Tax=Hydrogenimonas thermophila TaxID=223786 RepID=A0A1I5U3T8_9BACT|nr:glycosyltransferase [Hydrogenimonas thermophila]SFP89985.1 Glycosyltransferase involved in cell wall bisynthesis [Hydrogenimonas thermophila]